MSLNPAQALSTPDGLDSKRLIAYYSGSEPRVSVVQAPRWREWVNAMPTRWANHCLPLIVANQAGWTLLNPIAFEATWSGEPGYDALRIEFDGGAPPLSPLVTSLFGYGILSWSVPFLFRTPPGWNLLARGPANWPKDGISALEGLVETDWSIASFTMNWKFTRPNHPVAFEEGEPYCMVVPQRRGELESFAPELQPISNDSELEAASAAWEKQRHNTNVQRFLSNFTRDFDDELRETRLLYYKGLRPDATPAPEHQTHIRLREFAGATPDDRTSTD